MATTGAALVQSQHPGAFPKSPTWTQGPKHLDHPALLPQPSAGHWLGSGAPRLKPVPSGKLAVQAEALWATPQLQRVAPAVSPASLLASDDDSRSGGAAILTILGPHKRDPPLPGGPSTDGGGAVERCSHSALLPSRASRTDVPSRLSTHSRKCTSQVT